MKIGLRSANFENVFFRAIFEILPQTDFISVSARLLPTYLYCLPYISIQKEDIKNRCILFKEDTLKYMYTKFQGPKYWG